MVDAYPGYSLPAGTQEVEDKGRYGGNELHCTLYGKFQVTTANTITGLGDKPQIFDCGIYDVLGEARDGHRGPSSPGEFPVGSFEFYTSDGIWNPKCVSPTGGDECARCTYEKTAEECNRCCGGVMRLLTGSTSGLATRIDGAEGSSLECVSPTGGDECANQQCTYEQTAQTAKGCASCCGGVLRYKETCYTLYDGVVLNPTDKAECE